MLPLVLKYIGPKEGIIGILVVLVIWFGTMWHSDSIALKKATLVYENPKTNSTERILWKQGPVRIRTVYIKSKEGTETTTTEEIREPAESETVKSEESTPVPLAVTLKEPRTDRYLLSVGLNRLTPDFEGKAFFVGYGFKNRVDVQVGGMERDGWSPWVLTTLRF